MNSGWLAGAYGGGVGPAGETCGTAPGFSKRGSGSDVEVVEAFLRGNMDAVIGRTGRFFGSDRACTDSAPKPHTSTGRSATGEDCTIDVVVWPSTVKRSMTSSRCSTSRTCAVIT